MFWLIDYCRILGFNNICEMCGVSRFLQRLCILGTAMHSVFYILPDVHYLIKD